MTFSAKAPEVQKYVGEGPFWPYRADVRDPNYRHEGKYNTDHIENARVARAGAYWLAKELGHSVDPPVKQGATPAAAAGHTDLGPDKWIMDTGCGFDLIGFEDIPEMNHKIMMMSQCSNEIQLHTANGVTTVQNEVLLQVKYLHEQVTALVLDSTPPVLSIGKRCMDYIWACH